MNTYYHYEDIPEELKPYVKWEYSYYLEMKELFSNPNFQKMSDLELEEFIENGEGKHDLAKLEKMKRDGMFSAPGYNPEIDGYEIDYERMRRYEMYRLKKELAEHLELAQNVIQNSAVMSVTDDKVDLWEKRLTEIQSEINRRLGNPDLIDKIEQNKQKTIDKRNKLKLKIKQQSSSSI